MSGTRVAGGGVALAFAALLVVAAVGAGHSVAAPGARPSVGASGVDGTSPRVTTVENTTNYLFPGGEPLARQEYVRADLDVGSAVAVSATQLESDFRNRTLAHRLRQTGERDDQLAVVRQAVSRAERRMARLDATHEALLRGYSDGDVSREALAPRLARLEARAQQLRASVVNLEMQATATVGALPPALETRLSTLQSHAVVVPSPETEEVSERLLAAVTGRADPMLVYAGSTPDALVLATVRDGTFRRQTTLRGQHQPGAVNQFEQGDGQPIAQVAARAGELYPWAYSGDHATSIGRAGANLYRINSDYLGGELTAYISGSTTDVFHELHRQDPAGVPVSATVTNETASLNLTVTTTVATGPMRVRLSDDTGTSRNATVLVDGRRVGTTGDDGSLWTVRPAGAFTLTAVTETGERVVVGPGEFR